MSAALVGVAIARPAWLEVLGVEMASRVRPHGHVVVEPGKEVRVYAARRAAKGQIIDQLRSRELNLFEAAAWFRHIGLEPAQNADRSWRRFEGDSEGERLCRLVILWAANYLSGQMPASELRFFVAELEGQLADRLCAEGWVELPPGH